MNKSSIGQAQVVRAALHGRRHIPLPKGADLFRTNLWYLKGNLTIAVPRSAKKVYLPRKHHYSPRALTDADEGRLEQFEADLQPCVVVRGAHGWGWHECQWHKVYLYESP